MSSPLVPNRAVQLTRRLILPCTLVLVFAGCSEDGSPDGQKPKTEASGKGDGAVKKSASASKGAVTGTSVFQQESESIRKDIQRIEQEDEPKEAGDIQRQQRDLKMVIQNVDLHLSAIDVSIRAESRLIVQSQFKEGRSKQGKMRSHLDKLYREVSTIRELLKNTAKGTSEIPPGMTEDELKDRVADFEEAMLKVKEEESQLVTRLEAMQAQLELDVVPEQGETTLTQERAVLKSLRSRAEKLLDPS